MVGNFADCCARAVSGHPAAAPPRSEMNSRRLISLAKLEGDSLPLLRHSKIAGAMTEMGQYLPKLDVRVRSAFPPDNDQIADITIGRRRATRRHRSSLR
jgi:hypothetical protein